MSELGSHQIDAVGLLLSAMQDGNPVYPLSVSASSARPIFPPEREVDDHFYCTIDFPLRDYDARDLHARRNMIGMQYSAVNGNGFEGYGETVLGTEGTLIIERETDAFLFGRFSTTDKIRVTGGSMGPKILRDQKGDPVSAAVGNMATVAASRGYTEELEHWAWCIRNPAPDNQPRCHPRVALANAVVALTTRMSARTRQRIDFVEAWFDPDSDETPEGVKPDVRRYA
jgi:predicted dehydrogenase